MAEPGTTVIGFSLLAGSACLLIGSDSAIITEPFESVIKQVPALAVLSFVVHLFLKRLRESEASQQELIRDLRKQGDRDDD